jgi:hypothetical protein
LKISRQLERLAAVWTLEYRQELECLKWAKTYQSYERPDFVMWYLLGVRSLAWDWQIHCGSFGDSAVNMGISPNLEMLKIGWAYKWHDGGAVGVVLWVCWVVTSVG